MLSRRGRAHVRDEHRAEVPRGEEYQIRHHLGVWEEVTSKISTGVSKNLYGARPICNINSLFLRRERRAHVRDEHRAEVPRGEEYQIRHHLFLKKQVTSGGAS